MNILEILLIGISLSMDAFAVSICKGLSMNKIVYKKSIIIGLYFGLFQALMPLFGYLFGNTLRSLIISIDHWIIFLILFIIGINMVTEKNEEDNLNSKIDFKTMMLLAIATSIDAFAVGITFSFLDINILSSITIIGITTFIISIIGVIIGNKIGNKYQRKAKILGGLTLIFLGVKILLEHLNIIL